MLVSRKFTFTRLISQTLTTQFKLGSASLRSMDPFKYWSTITLAASVNSSKTWQSMLSSWLWILILTPTSTSQSYFWRRELSLTQKRALASTWWTWTRSQVLLLASATQTTQQVNLLWRASPTPSGKSSNTLTAKSSSQISIHTTSIQDFSRGSSRPSPGFCPLLRQRR